MAAAGFGQAEFKSGQIGRFIAGGREQSPQNRVLTEDGIQLAGQVSGVANNAAVFDLRPLGMRARQQHAGALGPLRVVEQRAGDLDFFAAHDVWQFVGLVEQNARRNQEVGAESAGHGDAFVGELLDIGRATHVRRFLPTLCAADHAAGHHRNVGPMRQPVAGDLGEGLLVAGGSRCWQVLDAM